MKINFYGSCPICKIKSNAMNFENSLNINFQSKKIPVYVIDKEGHYEKFPSGLEAALKIGVSQAGVSKVVQKKIHTTHNYTIVKASEVETTDENGNLVADKAKIRKHLQSFDKSIYAIRSDGQYQKFNSKKEAQQALDCNAQYIQMVLNGKLKALNGYTFIRARDVEIPDKTGETTLDGSKLSDMAQNIPDKRIYVIDENGNYQTFNSQSEVVEFLGCSKERISYILNSKNGRVKGYLVVRANEIETKCKNNQTVIDKIKIQKLLKRNDRSVYLIRANGECQKYPSQTQLAQALGIGQNIVSMIINGKMKAPSGYRIVRASDLEIFNDEGETVADSEKLNKILADMNNI